MGVMTYMSLDYSSCRVDVSELRGLFVALWELSGGSGSQGFWLRLWAFSFLALYVDSFLGLKV